MLTRTIQLPELHQAQRAIKRNAKRYNVVCCGRRFGKNILSHDLIISPLLQGEPVAWCTPTYRMLNDDWRLLVDITAPVRKDKSEQLHRLELITGGVLEMWSLADPDTVRGGAYKRIVVNEAAYVPNLWDAWSKVLLPTLIDLSGDAYFPSTPDGRNDYHRMYQMGVDPGNNDWYAVHHTSYDNPHIKASELDAMRETMTEREFRQEILAEFLEGEGQVFRNIAACTNLGVGDVYQHKGHMIVAGIDWAEDNDYTAISIGCASCGQELELIRFNQIDYHYQRMRVAEAFAKWGVRHAIAEQNSIGRPILTELQHEGIKIVGFQTTHLSKIAIIRELALALERGDVLFTNDPAGVAELEAYEMQKTKSGLQTYNAPDGMHDDTVIARALMRRAMMQAPRVADTSTFDSYISAIEELPI